MFASYKQCSFHDHLDVKQKGKYGKKRNCEDNPLCFYGLGEFKSNGGLWGNSSHLKAIQALSQQQHAAGAVQRRDPATQPAGFPNLGATCYMNSLLQSLFHNDRFRRLVYEYRNNGVDAVETMNGGGMTAQERHEHARELQRLFCQLDLSTAASIDPSNFVNMLKLETQIQQDAQEFNKLLLDHLSSVMGTSHLLDMFQGEIKYTNKCLECDTESGNSAPFLELELPLKNETDIASCLQTYSKTEALAGDNQYHCIKCARRVNAERRLEISKLPPILNLQLMRFVFDPSTLMKRKTKESIVIPEEIELRPGVWYDLKAVLFHKGQSANAGHYVAEILCGDGEWWCFNDHAVEKRHANKRATSTKNSSSGDAYMVVYHQRERALPEQRVKCEDTAPRDLVEWVLSENVQFKVNQQYLEEQKQLVEQECEQRRLLYQRVFLSDDLRLSEVDTRVWVPTTWLVSWIQGEPQPSPGKLFASIPDYTEFLCSAHGDKLDLVKAKLHMKLIPRQVWDAIATTTTPGEAHPIELCEVCAKQVMDRDATLKQELEGLHALDALFNKPVPMLNGQEEAVWISRAWIKDCREHLRMQMQLVKDQLAAMQSNKKRPRISTQEEEGKNEAEVNINADLVCEHGRLLARNKPQRRLILRKDWDEIVAQCDGGRWKSGSTVIPESSAVEDECEDCVQKRQLAMDWMQSDRALLKHAEFGPVLHTLVSRTSGFPVPQTSSVLVPVPRAFLDDLRDYLLEKTDDIPCGINLSMLCCSHGKLVLNHRALQFLSNSNNNNTASQLLADDDADDSLYGIEVEFVTEQEYAVIQRILSHDAAVAAVIAPITVELNNNKQLVAASPPICLECCDTLKRAFEHGRFVFQSRPVVLHHRKLSAVTTTQQQQIPPRVQVVVNSTDTLLQLKRKLWESCKGSARRAPPFDANAYFVYRCGYLLEDCDDLNLEQLGIAAGDDLHFEIHRSTAAPASNNDTSNGERGFSGTALVNSFAPSPVPTMVISPQSIVVEDEL